jgi:hypothetical protein
MVWHDIHFSSAASWNAMEELPTTKANAATMRAKKPNFMVFVILFFLLS